MSAKSKSTSFIQFGVHLNHELAIRTVTIDFNTTDLPSDSNLIKIVCMALLKSLVICKEDVQVQDLLNELNITRTK